MLMGFDEEKYNHLIDSNFKVRSNRNMLNQAKLIQLAGNSIVVQVLEHIFAQINEINEIYLTESNTVAYMAAPEIKITAK